MYDANMMTSHVGCECNLNAMTSCLHHVNVKGTTMMSCLCGVQTTQTPMTPCHIRCMWHKQNANPNDIMLMWFASYVNIMMSHQVCMTHTHVHGKVINMASLHAS